MKKLLLTLALGCSFSLQASANTTTELFVSVNSGDPQTQGMAMVLATQAVEQKAGVHVLLCSEGGQLAVKGKEFPVLKPRNVTPHQMLQGLMKAGAKVEVCALFLPNSGLKLADLIEGVEVAKPADVAKYFLQGHVKTLAF
jgi:predicted peroxiredoxin